MECIEQHSQIARWSSNPSVSVVKSTEYWIQNEASSGFDRALDRCVSPQSQVGAGSIVVVLIFPKNANQVSLAQRNHMIRTFLSDRSDHSFAVTILPWAPTAGDDLFDCHRFDLAYEDRSVDRIAIADQVSRLLAIARNGFLDLLRGPLCGRILRSVSTASPSDATG